MVLLMTNDTINLTRKATPADVKPKRRDHDMDKWEIRTLPRAAGGGYGVYFCASIADDRRWYTDNGYTALTPYTAERFEKSGAARKVRDQLNK